MMLNVNRLHYHYQNVLRQDLLLKCSHSPELLKMTILAQVPYESIKQKQLALELLCGQKSIVFESTKSVSGEPKALALRPMQFRFQKAPKYSIRTCLRGNLLYNFLDKLITVLCFQDLDIKFQNNVIQLTIPSNMVRIFPEIQNHFDLLSLYDLQIYIETSAQNKEETRLIWTGFYESTASFLSKTSL